MQTYHYRDTITAEPGAARARYYEIYRAARTLVSAGMYDVVSIGIDRARVICAHAAGGVVTHDWETLHAADPEACAAISLRAEMIREQLAIRAAVRGKRRTPQWQRRTLDYITRARRLRLLLADRGHLRLP